MEYKYTINDISETVKISKPSLYALIKKNSAFIKDNSIRKQRKIYYNQAAMDFFISYYSPEQAANIGKKGPTAEGSDTDEAKAENSLLEGSYTDKPQEREEEVSKAEIDALKAEIAVLRKQLEATETEKKELFRQNSQLLLLLQQEKQEKMLLLPAPKKSFSDKVKSLFKAKPQEN